MRLRIRVRIRGHGRGRGSGLRVAGWCTLHQALGNLDASTPSWPSTDPTRIYGRICEPGVSTHPLKRRGLLEASRGLQILDTQLRSQTRGKQTRLLTRDTRRGEANVCLRLQFLSPPLLLPVRPFPGTQGRQFLKAATPISVILGVP